MGAARGRVRSWLAAAVTGTALALLVTGLVLSQTLPGIRDPIGEGIMIGAVITALVGVGGMLAIKRSRNPIGWLLLASGTAWAGLTVVDPYAQHGWAQSPQPPGTITALWFATWLWLVGIIILPFVLLLFPDGRLPSVRWRPLLRLGVVAFCVTVLAQWLIPWGPDGYHYEYAMEAANPLHLPAVEAVRFPAAVVAGALMVVVSLGAIVSLVVRFGRADATVRRQMKWVVFGVTAALAAHVTAVVGGLVLGPRFDGADQYTFGFVLGAVPLTIGLAVLRYRLYDIDRIVSRTVSYALVTVTLIGVYAAGVLGLGSLVRTVAGEGSNDLVVAASTLAVAAAFGPVRRRVQRVVDRRFNRTRYDAARTVESFASRLREEVDLDVLVGDLRAVAVETMRPAGAGVWFPRPRRPA